MKFRVFLQFFLTWAERVTYTNRLSLLACSKPKVVILDESTSALDLENEINLYDLLCDTGITTISVGNRPSLVAFHQRILRLTGDGEWKMEEPQWKVDQK